MQRRHAAVVADTVCMVWCAIAATSLAPTIIVSVHDALVGAWMLDPDAAHSELTLAQVTKRHASTTSASASGSGSGSRGSRGGESEEGLTCARLLGADATPSACIARVTATVAVYDRIAAQLKGQRMWTAFECLVRAVSACPSRCTSSQCWWQAGNACHVVSGTHGAAWHRVRLVRVVASGGCVRGTPSACFWAVVLVGCRHADVVGAQDKVASLEVQAQRVLGRPLLVTSPQDVSKALFVDLKLTPPRWATRSARGHMPTSEGVLQAIRCDVSLRCAGCASRSHLHCRPWCSPQLPARPACHGTQPSEG